jgi:hypothetical protein
MKEHILLNKLQVRFYDTEGSMFIKREPMDEPIYESNDEIRSIYKKTY